MRFTSEALLAACQAALKAGTGFPAIWNDILKRNPLVLGMPEQVIREGVPALRIALIAGQALIFHGKAVELV